MPTEAFLNEKSNNQSSAYVNDPDRKSPEHDAICQFLCESWKKVYELVFPGEATDLGGEHEGEEQILASHNIMFVQLGATYESWKSSRSQAKSSNTL